MKKALKIAGLVFLGLFLVFGTALGIQVWSGIQEAKTQAAQEIHAPDLAGVPNGTWRGQVEWGILTVEVDVTVEQGQITAIDLLKHDNGKGGRAEAITQHILAAQSLDVDAITGATLSSRAILNAVANALNNSQ